MTRLQLRPFHTRERLAEIYDHPYDHTMWPDHIQRIEKTTRVLDEFAARIDARSVADLSCGDGAIVNGSSHDWDRIELSDLTRGAMIQDSLPRLAPVDMYVCSETLEHVEDPDWLLRTIREHAGALLLTTPCAKWDDNNDEHYWAWDTVDLSDMLVTAGWNNGKVELFTPTVSMYYTFQIWTCQ